MKQSAVEFISKGLFDILQEAEDNNIFEVGTQNFKRYIEMFLEQAKEMEKQQQGYSEEDMQSFALQCVANFLSNTKNEVEISLVEVIIDRNNEQFEKFKNK
jgi:hypothetical protein